MLSIRKPPRNPPGGFPGQNPEPPRGVSRSKIRKPPTWIAYSYNASKLHGNPPCGGFPGPKSGNPPCGGFPGPKSGNPPPRLINDDTVG